MTEAREPLPPLDDLDGLFELPDSVTNPRLRTLHEVLITRMRREMIETLAKAPTTVQLMVMERTAFNYILIRDKEQHPVGVPTPVGERPAEGPDTRVMAVQGFQHMTAAKEFNAFWLNLADQLNKMMTAGSQEFRDNLMKSAARAINGVLGEAVADPDERALLRQRIGAALAEAGV